MLLAVPSAATTRRSLLIGAGLLLARPTQAKAGGAVRSWLDYEARLSERLKDTGGARPDGGFARALIQEANRFRAGQGRDALAWDEGLAACARAHLGDMIARQYFAHESPEGFTHADRVSLLARDFCGQTAENLAWRHYPAERALPRHFQTMWEQSPAHRANLINASFGQAGCAVASLGGKVFAATVFADGVRLSRDVPLSVHGPAELEEAIAGVSPQIDGWSVTRPFERPTWMSTAAEPLRPLATGAWQLRPLRLSAGGRYDVLPGPLFHVA
jgi:uncharacterized protein YkwD